MLTLQKPLILASQSPRRKELLNLMGLTFGVDVPSTFQEFTPEHFPDPQVLVRENAKGKVEEVKSRHPDSIILGVDTVVSIQGKILGKPNSQEEAMSMLTQLQGQTHVVWTGVSLLDTVSGKEMTFEDATEVDFLPMIPKDIADYVQTGEPMDKAGAYAIQGLGSVYIRGIRGDFFNVVGLPIWHVHAALMEMV